MMGEAVDKDQRAGHGTLHDYPFQGLVEVEILQSLNTIETGVFSNNKQFQLYLLIHLQSYKNIYKWKDRKLMYNESGD